MKFFKELLKYIFVFILMIVIAWGALYITALIPRDKIQAKSAESAEILYLEKDEYNMKINFRNVLMHNYTDAIMLNTVYSIDTNNIVESIIKCRRNYLPGITEYIFEDKVGNLVGDDGDHLFLVEEYWNTLNEVSKNSYEYGRYWHGYMILLRPMLLFFNVTQIRIILTLILLISLIILAIFLSKETNKCMGILLLIAFISTDILCFFGNIQGVLVMLISVITAIFVANKKITLKNINIIFFIVGGLTAYFDFLTTPLITFLLPIIIFFTINKENNIKECLKHYILSAVAWGLGYILLWALKWIICDVVYDLGMIKIAIEQIIFRISSTELIVEKYQSLFAIIYNILYAINPINLVLFCIGMAHIFINISSIMKQYKFHYLISSFLVFMWYAVFANHSVQHSLYTYRLLVVPLICMLFIIFDDKKVDEKEN